MDYISRYQSPLGGITLSSDGRFLTGLWFDGQKYFGSPLGADYAERDLPVFRQAAEWLDRYFEGRQPHLRPPLRLRGTEFQREVWNLLLAIPRGQTATYAAIARRVADGHGLPRMSAQAVGLTRKRQRKRRSTRVPLVPPNPKEFESATSMSISRAWLAQ